MSGIAVVALLLIVIPFGMIAVAIAAINKKFGNKSLVLENKGGQARRYRLAYTLAILCTAVVNWILMRMDSGLERLFWTMFVCPLVTVAASLLTITLWQRGFEGSRRIPWNGAITMYFGPLFIIIFFHF